MSVYKEFSKPEIVKICEELDIVVEPDDTKKVLVDVILEDLDENGVPEDDEMSELLWQFVDYVYDDEEDEEPEEIEETSEETPNRIELDVLAIDHHCFRFYEKRDPACGKCPIATVCEEERIRVRTEELECFGKLYSASDEDCKNCLEAGPCRKIVERQ